MGKFSRLGNDLYEGTVSVDFVGKWKIWYSFSMVIIVIALSGLFFKGLNLGIEFEGGVEYAVSLPTSQVNQDSVDKLRNAVADTGIAEAKAPIVNTSGTETIRIRTEEMTPDQTNEVVDAIAQSMHVNADAKVSTQEVGASWGSQVANRAITGLYVFIFLVILFIWAYFREWKMSVGAVVALAHDIVITVGVYALSGFEVTPATVTGILTILGFSLYDTVVVFDKVNENTRNLRQSRRTYAEQANLAVNQTLVRSINTTIVALLPVGALLYVGVVTLGSGALKDLALSLFVGMAAGTYSSVFIATPLVVHLKEREKEVSQQDLRAKARARRDADRYAEVPVFSEDRPAADRGGLATIVEPFAEVEAEAPEQPPARPFQAPARRPSAAGSGRVVPTPKAPVTKSGSAKRNQPTRKPRSQRGK